jgi:hypothetical protein
MITAGERPYKLCAKWQAIFVLLPQYGDLIFNLKKNLLMNFASHFCPLLFGDILRIKKANMHQVGGLEEPWNNLTNMVKSYLLIASCF